MKLSLHYPVKPYLLYQGFGQNNACIEDNSLPVAQRNIVTKTGPTCPAGYTEFYPAVGMKGHNGQDMFGGHGVPVYHAGPDGTVDELSTEVERGLGVGVISRDRFEFEGGEYHAKTRNWHLLGLNVKKGEFVKTGHLLGWADNTGNSSGDHLHFELKPVLEDPEEAGYYYNVFQKNGYFGAVDPAPYWSGIYAVDYVEQRLFTRNLWLGQASDDVKRLQSVLQKLGFFPETMDLTGYYGPITKAAVYAFQKKYVALDWWSTIQVAANRGHGVFSLTRAALNKHV